MQPSDTGAHQPHLGAEKTRGRPRGHHGETVRQGREVREALEQGIPLGVQVANLLSHGIISDAKTLRRRLKAANKTDDLPSAARRSSSPAVTHALQRFRARRPPTVATNSTTPAAFTAEPHRRTTGRASLRYVSCAPSWSARWRMRPAGCRRTG